MIKAMVRVAKVAAVIIALLFVAALYKPLGTITAFNLLMYQLYNYASEVVLFVVQTAVVARGALGA